jgi:hypothetical protein
MKITSSLWLYPITSNTTHKMWHFGARRWKVLCIMKYVQGNEWLFTVLRPTREFIHLYGDVTIASEGLQKLGLCSAFRTFEQGGIFIVLHLLAVTRPRFSGLIRRTTPFSRLFGHVIKKNIISFISYHLIMLFLNDKTRIF